MNEFNPRTVTLKINIGGNVKSYTSSSQVDTYNIMAIGEKYANPLQNTAEIKISNLRKEDVDYILTETSPFNLNKTEKSVSLFAGRDPQGVALIYSGNIVSSKLSQPPDITLSLRCLTGDYKKNNVISRSKSAVSKLSDIAKNIADDLNLQLNFTANDKDISNYNFTGSIIREVNLLSQLSDIDAFIDDESLVIKQSSLPLPSVIKEVNKETGMIGIVDITERGIKVIFLLDNLTKVGALIRVKSDNNKSVNGDYIIYKLGFNITTRDIPFYYIAEGKRLT